MTRARGAPDPASRVAAIGLSRQTHGTVLLSGDLRPLGPALIWPDKRSARQVEALTAEVGRERLIDIVGGPLATGFQAATARWFRDEEPARWAEMRMVVTPKDALRLRLTGELATDPSDGSGTGPLDETTRRWSDEILAAVGLEPDRLPPLRDASASAGTLLPEPATHWPASSEWASSHRMVPWAEDVPIGARRLVFLPHLTGERSPPMDPAARGVFLGLTARHGRPELVQAVLEGVTLACFDASRVLSRGPRAAGSPRPGRRRGAQPALAADRRRRLRYAPSAARGRRTGGHRRLHPRRGRGRPGRSGTASRAWARLGGAVEPDDPRHVRYLELLELFGDAYAANRVRDREFPRNLTLAPDQGAILTPDRTSTDG